MAHRVIRIVIALCLMVLSVMQARNCNAAAIISLTSSGVAEYSVTTTDLPDSAGLDLVITYDSTALSAPLVKAGALTAGAMMEKNINTAGTIRIVFITAGAIKGTGQLASVAFTRKGSGPVPTPVLTSRVYSAAGTQLAVQSVNQPAEVTAPPSSTVSDSTTTTATVPAATAATTTGSTPAAASSAETSITPPVTVAAPVVAAAPATTSKAGTAATSSATSVSQSVNLSGSTVVASGTSLVSKDQNTLFGEVSRPNADREEQSAGNDPAPIAAAPPAQNEIETAPSLKVAKPDEPAQPLSPRRIQSVADRLKAFDGVRSVRNFSKFFDGSDLSATGIFQAPAIAVSDGTSPVKITVERTDDADEPSFSLKGANQKSIRKVSEKKWELVALPQKGKSDVRLSIILKREHLVVPLVVVQPLDPVQIPLTVLSENALNALLAKPVDGKKLQYDLNSDGRQDYLDDYLLIAHWLLKQQGAARGVNLKPVAAGK